MSTGAKIGTAFALAIAVIVTLGVSLYVSAQRFREANRWVTHTHEVIEESERLLSVLQDAETGQRGFVLTGQERYLEPYNTAVVRIRHETEVLIRLTRDNPAQQQSLQRVQSLSDAKLAELGETIQLRKKSGLQAVLPVVLSDRGKKIMDDLRGVIEEMEAREQRLLDKRNAEASASADRATQTIVVWMPLSLLVLAIAVVVFLRTARFAGMAVRTPQSKWAVIAIQYGCAVILVAVASALQGRLIEAFGPLPTFLLFYPAVLLAATIGGGGPGILATVLAALAADYWFIPPFGSFSITATHDILALGIFFGAGFFISILAERLRRSRWAEAISIAQERQLDEMSRLNEELSQQSEELSQQTEELSQQNEELQSQSEEIHTLNTELEHREDVLQKLLDAARLGATEQTVMQEICAAAKEMFGPAASAVLVLEPRADRLLLRAQAGLGPEAATLGSVPAAHCFAELVVAENKTAALTDASLRRDFTMLHLPGEQPFQAVLAAPMRADGKPFGVVGIYSHRTQQWTAEQFRLVEWLAAQCAHILETLRLQEQLRRLYAEQQTIFNSVPAMIWYKDAKNNFVRVNRAVALAVGKPAEEIEGKNAADIFPDEAQRYYQDDLEVINSGQPKLGILEEMGTADGQKRWVQTDKIPYRDELGNIAGVLVLSVDITERKRADDAVRQSQELLQAIIDNTPALIYVKDLEGRITVASRLLGDVVGVDAHDIVGKTSREFVANPEDAEIHTANDRRVVKTGQAITVEESSRGRVFLSVKFPLRDAQGRIFATGGVSTDITDRKRAEEAVRESESRFRTLADAMPQLAWIAKADGYIYWYNQRWYHYTGTTPEQMEGWGWQSVHDPEALPKVMEQWKASIATGEPFDMTFPLRGADGVFRPYLTRGMPLKDEQGRVQQWFGTNTDVSEQKRAEEERARVAAIVESSDDAILSKDLNGIIQTWNAGAERLLGYRAEEVIGQPITLLLPPERIREEEQILERLLHGQRVEHLETVRQAKDGKRIDVSVTVSPIKGHDGQIIGASKIVHDITDRKQAEETIAKERANLRAVFDVVNVGMLVISEDGAVKQVNDTLSRWVKKDVLAWEGGQPGDFVGCVHALADPAGCGHGPRCGSCPIRNAFTSVLQTGLPIHDVETEAILAVDGSEVRLWLEVSADPLLLDGKPHVILSMNNITARKQAEEALQQTAEELARSNKDLEQFASVASHDLQEPLRTITGFVQLLQKKYAAQLDAEAGQYIDFAVDGAKRMETLIHDLLAYSRVSVRGKELTPTDAVAALRRALDNLQTSIHETAAEITHGELPTVQADGTQLAQLFQNLIGNALKFRGAAPPKIHVDACRKVGQWQFTVRDNGIGIDPKYRERIFQIFQRLHTRTQYPGTGVGLAICKRIVDRHGGQIWVESQPGQGATFHFTFPA